MNKMNLLLIYRTTSI